MRWPVLLVVSALVTTACGTPSGGGGGSELGSTSTQGTNHREDPPPSVEACGLSDPWDMVETAFVATVAEVETRVKEQSQGEVDEQGLNGSAPEWPWVTFVVDRWFTDDFGTRFSMWAPGFEGAPGQEWQIAGALYWDWVMGEQSGEVFDCLSVPVSETELTVWDERFGGSVVAGSDTPEGEPDPELLARIEDHRAIWASRRPDSYTAILSAYEGRQMADECGAGNPVRLVVEDGQPVEAVDLRRSCRMGDPNNAYSVDDLFDLASDAAAAIEGDITFDEEYGFITGFYAADRSIEVSGGVEFLADVAAPAVMGTEEVLAATADARVRWDQAGIGSYLIRVESLCFCGGSGSYEATVVDGAVQDVRRLEGLAEVEPLDASSFFTVEGLFDDIAAWADEAPESFVAGFSEAGYPVDFHVDVRFDTSDDEFTVLVRELTPLP